MGIVRGRSRYIRGTHNSLSDDSGQKYKRRDMRLTWDNKLVGIDEWEPKHPQLTIRPRPDSPAIVDQTRVNGRTEELAVPSFNPGALTLDSGVINSAGTEFEVDNTVFDSDDNLFQVSADACSSAGQAYTVFTYS